MADRIVVGQALKAAGNAGHPRIAIITGVDQSRNLWRRRPYRTKRPWPVRASPKLSNYFHHFEYIGDWGAKFFAQTTSSKENRVKRRTFLIGGPALLISNACVRSVQPYRYRITVEIETPEGIKRGHSVIEVRPQYTNLGIYKGTGYKVTGEAVIVDLGTRGLLTALL